MARDSFTDRSQNRNQENNRGTERENADARHHHHRFQKDAASLVGEKSPCILPAQKQQKITPRLGPAAEAGSGKDPQNPRLGRIVDHNRQCVRIPDQGFDCADVDRRASESRRRHGRQENLAGAVDHVEVCGRAGLTEMQKKFP